MTEEQIKCRKAYYSIAKKRCPFTDEDLQNGYYEGFMDGASEMARKDFEATKELEAQIEKMKCCFNCAHVKETRGEGVCFTCMLHNKHDNWELEK